jgi:hypothetical protein
LESAGVSQSVSFAADVANYRGFLGAVDGCTQPTRVHIETVGLRNEFIVPFILDKSCARQQLAAPLHHLLEQLEFALRQMNLPVAALRSAIDEIKLTRRTVSRDSTGDRTEESILGIMITIDRGGLPRLSISLRMWLLMLTDLLEKSGRAKGKIGCE